MLEYGVIPEKHRARSRLWQNLCFDTRSERATFGERMPTWKALLLLKMKTMKRMMSMFSHKPISLKSSP